MTDKNRRNFNKLLGGGAVLVPLSALLSSQKAVAAPVDPESDQAKALSFALESDKDGQTCAGCVFYSTVDDTTGKCIIFASNEVPAAGWCSSFQQK